MARPRRKSGPDQEKGPEATIQGLNLPPALWRSAVEQGDGPLCLLDSQGRILFLNRAHQRIFGQPLRGPGGLPLAHFHPPEADDIIAQDILPALAQGLAWEGEIRGRTSTGRLLPLRLRCLPFMDAKGELLYSQVHIQDLSEIRHAREALEVSQARYLAILEDQTELICRSDDQGRLSFVNEAYCRFFGKNRDELLDRRFLPLLPDPEGGRLAQHLASLNPRNPLGDITLRLVGPAGQPRMLRWTTRAIFDREGHFSEFQSVGRDVTEQVLAEQALRQSQARYLAILEDQTELICRSDDQGRLTFVNEAYCRFFGKNRDELVGHHFLPNLPHEDGVRLAQHLNSLNRDNRLGNLEHRVFTPSGELRVLRWTTRAIFDQGGNLSEFQSVGRDVTERHLAQEALREAHDTLEERVKERTRELGEVNRKLALTVAELQQARDELQRISLQDGLTGVANRRFFDSQSEMEWRRAAREGTPLAVVMVDIDLFKAYNDTYGHQAGDDCLRRVAQALQGEIKRSGDFLARYGGEEFVAVMPGVDLDGGLALAERMRFSVQALGLEHRHGLDGQIVTVSLGVASAQPAPGQDLSALVQAADQALYAAKQAGRNRVAATSS
jgi:diguanylate cyclase (GGDEF)-like protein/PAS domain S-box-containing protein